MLDALESEMGADRKQIARFDGDDAPVFRGTTKVGAMPWQMPRQIYHDRGSEDM
jgi:hypothetical protein